MNTMTLAPSSQAISKFLDCALPAAVNANAPKPLNPVAESQLLTALRIDMNWANAGRALLERDALLKGERTVDGKTAVGKVHAPTSPEDEPSLLRATMLDYVSRYARSQTLPRDLQLLFEKIISSADHQYAFGPTLKVRHLSRDRADIRRQLPSIFSDERRAEAEAIKLEIDEAVLLLEPEKQCRYRLFSELFAISDDEKARTSWLAELYQIDAACAAKTEKLDSLTHEAIKLSQRYEKINVELEIERYLPARIRFAYAQILIEEADKCCQIRALTPGKRFIEKARELLSEAALIDRSLLIDDMFTKFARKAGLGCQIRDDQVDAVHACSDVLLK